MKNLLLLFFLFLSSSILGQGIKFNSSNALKGYTLFNNNNAVYLINNCGEIVNTWSGVFPKYHCKLTDEGNLLYIDWQTDAIVEQNWANVIVKSTSINDNTINLDYEVILLPNGNYLSLGRKEWSIEDFINIGYDPNNGSNPNLVDVVLEIIPVTGEIVWQWNIAEHIIQERDPNAENYGSVIDNPQLLNLDAISDFDWTFGESFMINGMGYNSSLDQIVLSVRKMSEVVVIDHSTTSSEVTGHSGGHHGKGGDIIYRWGNPMNYNRGSETQRQLYYQHSPNWVEHGTHKGHLTLFNNGLNRPGTTFETRYSGVPIIATPIDDNGLYSIESDQAYLPTEPAVDISSVETGTEFYSGYTSGAKVLPNENLLITVGGMIRILEVNYDGNIAWEYEVFESGLLFRSEKYPDDFIGFENKDLTPMGTVEFPSSTYPCELSGIDDWGQSFEHINIYVDAYRSINITNSKKEILALEVMDIKGASLIKDKLSGEMRIPMQQYPGGIYVVNITSKNEQRAFRLWIP